MNFLNMAAGPGDRKTRTYKVVCPTWPSLNECESESNFKRRLRRRCPLTELRSSNIVNSSSNDSVCPLFLSQSCRFLFFSFPFPISEHPITHQAKGTIEDYSSQLFQLIAAKESAGEQAWCEKWFVRFEQPRFWFLNAQINSQAGLGFLSAACSVFDGARLEEVLNAAFFPEGPPGVAKAATWMQIFVDFFSHVNCFFLHPPSGAF